MPIPRRAATWLAAALALALATTGLIASAGPAASAGKPQPTGVDYTLTVLHFNDGESDLLPDENGAGGISRFGELLQDLQVAADDENELGNQGRGKGKGPNTRGVVTLTSGDNFLAGPELEVGRANDRFYDVIALDYLDIDAFTIGNHEFDFGPQFLAEFIGQFEGGDDVFITTNLDFSNEPSLAALEDQGRIADSVIVKDRGEKIGIVGATTPDLEEVSSPGQTIIDPDVAAAIQAEVDRLTQHNIDKIIVASHLQDIDNELELVTQLRNVDAVVGGGGGEDITASYPLEATDADGDIVPVVTVPGDYFDVGQLVLEFDKQGDVVGYGGTLVPVTGDLPQDQFLLENVEQPVTEFLAELDETVVAQSDVDLNGIRNEVRSRETNLGNLMADAHLDAAQERAASFGVPMPVVGLQNGGGIRNDSMIGDGELTLLDTFDIAPFSNFIAVLPDVDRADFVAAVEHGLSGLPDAAGSFAQWSGLTVTYDMTQPAGSRIVDLTLDNGQQIVVNGVTQPGAPVSIATIDFLAGGNDGYDTFETYDFVRVGISYQQALAEYAGELGTIGGPEYVERYDVNQRTRIIPING